MLAAVAEIADGTRSLADTVAERNDLVAPAVADTAVLAVERMTVAAPAAAVRRGPRHDCERRP